MEKEFIRQMRAHGERVSSPRLMVFRAISRKNAVTIPQLVQTLQANAVDSATTYRTIKLFRELGMIREIVAGGRRMIELNDSFGGHHHHFWCRTCGRLIDFDDGRLEKELHDLAKRKGFHITSHQVDISGLCKECSDKLDPKKE